MVVHFHCTNAADLCKLATSVGPHFTCEPDTSGAFVGAVECKSSAAVEYLRSLASVTVLPLPRKHGEPLTDAHISLIAKRYGVKKGDTMSDALDKIRSKHPTHWFDADNF